jgi:hypothetical protein
MSVLGDTVSAPDSKAGVLQRACLDLLAEHERDGALPTSIRFLYYELVQRGIVSKTRTGARRTDQDTIDALTRLREAGQIPWDWIVDETRSLDDYTGYSTIKQGVLDHLPYIHLDPWRGRAPMILTESRATAGVLRSTVSEYAARISATNGQVAGHLRTVIAPQLHPGDRVLYLGDYDLAGGQIEDNTRHVLEQEIGGPLQWERVALTREQVEEYNLPVIIKSDRRYSDGRPHEAVETEALRQTVLVEILRARLDALLPEPLAHVHERAERQRRAVATLLRGTR